MGIWNRIKAALNRGGDRADGGAEAAATIVSAYLRGGDDDLEVVGESNYQNALWSICNRQMGDRVRHRIAAVLVPEPENPYDPNAISVQVDGSRVGYLPREVAARYLPGLVRLMSACGGHIALEGVIVGGGWYDDGPGRLGVWLDHDPRDFGVVVPTAIRLTGRAAQRGDRQSTTMRTGFSEAWLTDAEDDSYDLSWFNQLPDADAPAIAMLRDLLATDPDPIDRHFQFTELEARLYRVCDIHPTALAEYDEVCRLHDAEIETIRQAFINKWGKVPLLETYRQMAIRQQKQKDWAACLWWAERGLALYGDDAARRDAVEDLRKRRSRALTKIDGESVPVEHKPGSSAVRGGGSRRGG